MNDVQHLWNDTGEHQSTCRETCSSAALFTINPHFDRLGIKHEPPRRDTLDHVPEPWHGHHHFYKLQTK
jgi:hypothetical protein